MSEADNKRQRLVGMAVTGALVGLTVAFGFWMKGLMDDAPVTQKQVVQVQVFRPPPPPPEVDEPPPPPEMEEEEVDIPEPEAEIDEPEMPDMPPPGELLGLDADGVAGGDAFGLVGRKGGRSLVGGQGQFRWYASRITDEILDSLGKEDSIRRQSYSISVLVWVDDDGELGRYELLSSTGDQSLDQSLKKALAEIAGFSAPPPGGLPQPMRIRIVSRV